MLTSRHARDRVYIHVHRRIAAQSLPCDQIEPLGGDVVGVQVRGPVSPHDRLERLRWASLCDMGPCECDVRELIACSGSSAHVFSV